MHGERAAQLRGICRRYCHPDGTVMVDALRGIDLDIPRGQYLAIMGASGSGKSTLMNILGCLDRPTSGQYLLDGEDVAQLSDEQLSLVRGRRIGFVFQAFNLIPELSVLENVEVPLFYQGLDRNVRRARAGKDRNRGAVIPHVAPTLRTVGRPAATRRDRACARFRSVDHHGG